MPIGIKIGITIGRGKPPAATYGPELLPNTDFANSTNVTLSSGATVAGGNLDLGTALFGAGAEGFTYTYPSGEVLALNIVLARAGNCQLSAKLGYGGGSQYGVFEIGASGEFLFTTTEPGTAVPLEFTLYNGAAGATSPQIASASLKKKS